MSKLKSHMLLTCKNFIFSDFTRKNIFAPGNGGGMGEDEGKVLFSRIAKPGMFGLGMTLKKNFFTYSIQFIFMIIRVVLGNVVMVAIGMCGKGPIPGE